MTLARSPAIALVLLTAGARTLEERVAERARFLTPGGLLMCAFFLGVVLPDELPKLLLSPWD